MEDTVSLLPTFGSHITSLFPISIYFKGITRPSPHPRGGNYTGEQISGGRESLGSILEVVYHLL